jgi:uncharacterized protein (TIGR00375 family)
MLYVDLHLHSFYYPGASKKCTFENILQFAKLKGLNVIGTGDALHPKWRKILKMNLSKKGDIYEKDGIYFIPTTEVRLNGYVHSIIVLPSLEDFDKLYDILKNYGKLDNTSVPFVYISGERILEITKDLGGFLFPAHPFIPFQSIYAKYKKLQDYFGKEEKAEIFCVEITPSVDNTMAEKVKDIYNKTFLSNSDAHNPMHLGREFNLIYAEPSFSSIMSAIKENRVVNYEMPPMLGKYYETACKKCKTFYHYNDAKVLDFKCENCGGKIWIGTKDRIDFELEKGNSDKRHKLICHVPLAIILRDLLSVKDPNEEALKILRQYRYKEIELLHFVDLEKAKIPENLRKVIKIIREGRFYVYPGGGWSDGRILLEKPEVKYHIRKQKTLDLPRG